MKLVRLFRAAHTTLEARLLGASVIDHPGEKGCASENDWRGLLRTHLPQRYAVDSAFLVDSKGAQSEQLDIVVYDRHYSPLLLDQSGIRFLPAESVYAVLEVKQEISKATIAYAQKKVGSARRLFRTSARLVDKGVAAPPRPLPRILGGLLASRCAWSKGYTSQLTKNLGDTKGGSALDFGCALTTGAFEMSPGGVLVSKQDVALMAFLFCLLRRLQEMGTVPAIDWAAYEDAMRAGP